MSNCIFCDICLKEVTANIIYQDEVLSCFLPQNMEVYGHLLVAPNKHYQNIFDIPEEEISYIFKFAKKMSNHLKNKLGATGVNILHASGKDAGQSVNHFHIHIFSRFENDGIDAWPKIEKKQFDNKEVYQKLLNI